MVSHDWQEVLNIAASLWKHKLFTLAGVDIRLGNLVVALTLLLFSSRLSRLVVKIINHRLIERFVEDRGSRNTYQTFAFYGAFALFVALSLTLAGIPLTIFTVVGGALAIGVGFGSQNIVNNFISGVIMLVEQPIRVGDVVEIDGIVGTVLSINTRSSKIKTGEHKVFVIPNSFFLEKSVLNWNYETTTVRTQIEFGVAYGSDVRLVENLCTHILINTQGVEQAPMPKIIFNEFGESTLNFQLFFWCDMSKIDSLMDMRSRIRFEIDRQFKENKIEMAFPQRDVSLKIARPMEVKVLT